MNERKWGKMANFLIQLKEICRVSLKDTATGKRRYFDLKSYSSGQFSFKSRIPFQKCSSHFFEVRLPNMSQSIKGKCVFLKSDEGNCIFSILQFEGRGATLWGEHFAQRLQKLKAEDIMVHSPMCLSPEEKVSVVIEKMNSINAGSVLITDKNKKLLGIFTERDIMNKCSHPDFFNSPVSRYMTANPISIESSACVEEVYMKFHGAHFRHLPITQNKKLVGIISMRDLIQYWSHLLETQKSNIMKKYEKTMSVIVHDLRSPIFAVRSINEVLLLGIESPESFNENGFPKLINDSCETMISLIDDLLSVTKDNGQTAVLEREKIQLPQLVQKVLKTFEPSAKEKGITIEKNISNEIPKMNLDARRITQVVQNLTSNAIKYSDKNSVIKIDLIQQRNKIKLSVTDHGQGIQPHEIEKVFDELCKISSKPTNNEPSTGLGLSIAKRLVEAHDGEITVSSQPNKETCFTVFLPLDQQSMRQAA